MTRVQAIKEHIQMRETYFEKKFNPLEYAYGFFRCLFHSQETIEGATRGLREHMATNGTLSEFKRKIGA